MADLDDFFAKKDRKKAKGKKFTTTEEIARKLEETGKKLEKAKPKDKPTNPEGSDENQPVEDDDEWKEFEEEKKDYTGLKIGNLTVTETVLTDTDNEKGGGENSSDQESAEGSNKQSGPWKKADAPSQSASEPEPEPAQPPPQPAAQPEKSVYRPPGFRNPQPEAPLRRFRKNVAPDINSEEYFPTLNSKAPSNDPGGVWGKKKPEGNFEEVRNRGGSRTFGTPETPAQAPKLSLGNKYDALSQDQS